MQKLNAIVLAVLLLTLIHVADASASNRDIKENIVYCQNLIMDIAQPDGHEQAPAVVVLHAGGWASGSKADSRENYRAVGRAWVCGRGDQLPFCPRSYISRSD